MDLFVMRCYTARILRYTHFHLQLWNCTKTGDQVAPSFGPPSSRHRGLGRYPTEAEGCLTLPIY